MLYFCHQMAPKYHRPLSDAPIQHESLFFSKPQPKICCLCCLNPVSDTYNHIWEEFIGKIAELHVFNFFLSFLPDAISSANPRVIDDSRARKLSNDLKRCTYYETCATYGLNVERVFQDGKKSRREASVRRAVLWEGDITTPPPPSLLQSRGHSDTLNRAAIKN